MKLYTRPRPLSAYQLRPGDQFAAVKSNGRALETEAAYVDADLSEDVRWTVVHAVVPSADPDAADGDVDVHHSLGVTGPVRLHRPFITREVLELDPWTYVDRAR